MNLSQKNKQTNKTDNRENANNNNQSLYAVDECGEEYKIYARGDVYYIRDMNGPADWTAIGYIIINVVENRVGRAPKSSSYC